MIKPKSLIALFPCLSGMLLVGIFGADLITAAATDTQNAKKTVAHPVDPVLLKQAHVLYTPDKLPPAGSILSSVDTMDMKDGKMNIVMGDKNINGISNMTGLKKTTTTFIDANSIETKYEQDKLDQKMTMNGQVQNMPAKIGDLVGKTIVFKKENGKWSGAFKGEEEATEKQNEKLAKKVKKLNNPEKAHILGTKPRKVGDTWDVDVSKLSSFGDGDEPPKGTFKVTFKTIVNYQGHACAVFEADVDVTGKGKDGMSVRIKGKNTVHHSLKYQVTLQNKMDGTMSISGDIQGGAGSVKVDGPAKMLEKKELKLR